MAVRSRMFAAVGINTGTGAQTLYTVPAGRTAVVRFLCVTNFTGAVLEGRIRVRVNGTSYVMLIASGIPSVASHVFPTDDLVINPGDALECEAMGSGANTARFFAAGSLLMGAPE